MSYCSVEGRLESVLCNINKESCGQVLVNICEIKMICLIIPLNVSMCSPVKSAISEIDEMPLGMPVEMPGSLGHCRVSVSVHVAVGICAELVYSIISSKPSS